MSAKLDTSLPSGFSELSPEKEIIRNQWLKTITDVFEKNGFLPVCTPLVERQENLLGKGGNPKEMYILKRLHDESDGDTGNALRFDHTVPLALYIARHQNSITFPFRRYAIGPVFRGERAQKGRFRQFDQCDIDIIGSESLGLMNDALLIPVIVEIFSKLQIGKFCVSVNNRKILLGFFQDFSDDPDIIKQAIKIVDDIYKISPEKFRECFADIGFNEKQVEKVVDFFSTVIENKDIDTVLTTFSDNAMFQEGCQEIKAVFSFLRDMQVDDTCYAFNACIARGLDYYTGTIYETYLTDAREFGAICAGGRYDDLGAVFSNRSLPGVGVSIGITRLLSQLFEAGRIDLQKTTLSDVVVLHADPSAISKSISLSRSLIQADIKTLLYTEDKKFAKKLDYAHKTGVEWCVIVGENEIKEQCVIVKNMKSGEEQSIKETNLISFFKNL